MIKAVFFDVDGTLLNTTEFIYQSFEHVLNDKKITNYNRTHFQPLIGKPLEECYKTLIPEGDFELLRTMHVEFQMKNLHLAVSFKEVKKTILALKKKRIKIAAITSRIRLSVHETLKLNELLDLFDTTICVDDVTNLKPHPEPLLKALEYFKIKPSEAIMVGDTDSDVEAGRNAKVKTVGVTYGFSTKEEMEAFKPDYLINSIEEILPIVESLSVSS